AAVTIVSIFLGIYAIRHLPFIDFRAYRIGNNIPQQMIPEEQPRFEYVFLEKSTGKEITSDKYMNDTTAYKYVRVRQTNEEKTRPKILDYAVSTVDGDDITQETFQGAKLIFVIADVDKASVDNIAEIRDLIRRLDGKIDMMIMTASSGEKFEHFRHEHQLALPYYFVDATVLKTMLRSNPGMTLWVDGTVRGMWHHNDTPDAEEVLSLAK
ncbi:MAG TPA: DoxX family protein, partial [Chryseosolibacter sp.]|nr:DoxX family protein [Chryseosolibacter sp.]